jgi:hypothetical protein
MRPTLALVSIAAALVQACSSQAPQPSATTGPMGPGGMPDANRDGVVTRQEAQGYPRLAAGFDGWDKDGNGSLDAAEMAAHRAAMHGEMRAKARGRWGAADKDGNGKLSRQEVEAAMPQLAADFDKMDHDRDGEISLDERHNFRVGQSNPQ